MSAKHDRLALALGLAAYAALAALAFVPAVSPLAVFSLIVPVLVGLHLLDHGSIANFLAAVTAMLGFAVDMKLSKGQSPVLFSSIGASLVTVIAFEIRRARLTGQRRLTAAERDRLDEQAKRVGQDIDFYQGRLTTL